MPVIIQHNEEYIRQLTTQRISLANRLIIEDIHRNSIFNTPMLSSQLRRNVLKTVVPETYTGTIIWRQPYASYQERGMRADGTHVVKNYTTPGTGKDFAKNAVNKTLKQVKKFYTHLL